MFVQHRERHRTDRIGWLRAAVLGANDGIVSTASLVVGVAAAHSTAGDILVAGVAGLVAGAISMAAGEYASVSSQADTENADLDRERLQGKTLQVWQIAVRRRKNASDYVYFSKRYLLVRGLRIVPSPRYPNRFACRWNVSTLSSGHIPAIEFMRRGS